MSTGRLVVLACWVLAAGGCGFEGLGTNDDCPVVGAFRCSSYPPYGSVWERCVPRDSTNRSGFWLQEGCEPNLNGGDCFNSARCSYGYCSC